MNCEHTPIPTNVKPSKIIVEEKYHYDLKIRKNADIQPNKESSPKGEITIEVPYDGYKYFPIDVAEQITQFIRKQEIESGEPLDWEIISGQIGWIESGEPLDWEKEWSQKIGANPIAVNIPLQEIFKENWWIANQYQALGKYTYDAPVPLYSPLKIDVKVYDGKPDRLEKIEETYKKLENKDIQDMLQYLNGQTLSGGMVVLEMIMTVQIPEVLIKENLAVCIDELSFLWPNIAPAWQVEVYEGFYGEKIKWQYDPARNSIILSPIPTKLLPIKVGSPFQSYQSIITLVLNSPEKIVAKNELKGICRFRLDNLLLSGKNIGWLDAGGRRLKKIESEIKSKTIFEGSFSVNLMEQFQHREATLYRQWYFPGVSLSIARLDDLATTLRDLGYRITETPQAIKKEKEEEWTGEVKENTIVVGAVAGYRDYIEKDRELARLEMQIWAFRAALGMTKREHPLIKEGTVSTTLRTSDLIIQVRGKMNGSGSLLAIDMDKLMKLLKNRFSSVADMR